MGRVGSEKEDSSHSYPECSKIHLYLPIRYEKIFSRLSSGLQEREERKRTRNGKGDENREKEEKGKGKKGREICREKEGGVRKERKEERILALRVVALSVNGPKVNLNLLLVLK